MASTTTKATQFIRATCRNSTSPYVAITTRNNTTRAFFNTNYNINISNFDSMSISKREMSSSPGFFDRISGAFSDRADRKKEEQMTEQLIKMSEYEVWNLQTYADDLNTSMSDWKTKIPGMGYTQQVKTMKEAQKVMKAVMDHIGGDATGETLENLTRKEKLQIAVAGDVHVEDIDIMVAQFQNMQMMHKVLRYRKANGKSIPKDEASMTLAVQQDALKVMTKKEKAKMQKQMQARAIRSMKR